MRSTTKRPDITRQRIVDAAVALHEEIGPTATSLSAIAARAGVERLTLYRHFPDRRAILLGCSAHWRELHPFPDPSSWSGIADPEARCIIALNRLYSWYARGEPMLARVLDDVHRESDVALVTEPMFAFLRELAAGLASGWGTMAPAQRKLRALAGLAVRFETWKALRDEGLPHEDAVQTLVHAMRCTAR